MNKTFKHPILCYDIVFKTIFTKNPNLLAKLISDITEIPYFLLKDNIILETNELPINKQDEKAKRCDFIVKFDKNTIINIELNRQSHTGLIIKNLSYIFKLFSTNFSKGKDYDKNFQVMQININCFKENNIKPLSKYYLKEEIDNNIYTKNIVIYSLNIVNCHEVYYNKTNKNNPNYINWGTIIYSNNLKEINKISKKFFSNEERNIFMEELDKITNNELYMTAEESIRLYEWEKRMMLEDAREEGLEQGINQIIQSLLKKNVSLEDISDITGKSLEEITKISKNN